MVDLELSSVPHDIPVVTGDLKKISHFQSAVGTGPQIISFGGCNAGVLKALDRDPDRQVGIQNPFCIEPFDMKKLMYEPSYTVLGGNDMFSLLQTVLPHISVI